MVKPFQSYKDLTTWMHKLIINQIPLPYGVICSPEFFEDIQQRNSLIGLVGKLPVPLVWSNFQGNSILCVGEEFLKEKDK